MSVARRRLNMRTKRGFRFLSVCLFCGFSPVARRALAADPSRSMLRRIWGVTGQWYSFLVSVFFLPFAIRREGPTPSSTLTLGCCDWCVGNTGKNFLRRNCVALRSFSDAWCRRLTTKWKESFKRLDLKATPIDGKAVLKEYILGHKESTSRVE